MLCLGFRGRVFVGLGVVACAVGVDSWFVVGWLCACWVIVSGLIDL